jgi:hypothetical protein
LPLGLASVEGLGRIRHSAVDPWLTSRGGPEVSPGTGQSGEGFLEGFSCNASAECCRDGFDGIWRREVVFMPHAPDLLNNLLARAERRGIGLRMPILNEQGSKDRRKAVGESKRLLNGKATPKGAKHPIDHVPGHVGSLESGGVARGDHEPLELD